MQSWEMYFAAKKDARLHQVLCTLGKGIRQSKKVSSRSLVTHVCVVLQKKISQEKMYFGSKKNGAKFHQTYTKSTVQFKFEVLTHFKGQVMLPAYCCSEIFLLIETKMKFVEIFAN